MMIIVQSFAMPDHLRGYTGRYLQEVTANFFVGTVSARVADQLWETLCANAAGSEVVMVISTNNEVGFDIRTCNPKQGDIVDWDGIPMVLRRHVTSDHDE